MHGKEKMVAFADGQGHQGTSTCGIARKGGHTMPLPTKRGQTDGDVARSIGWTAKRIGEMRSRYVDEARVIVSMVERLSA